MCTEGLKACNFVKRLQHRCFTVKFAKILRTPPVAAYEFCPGGCFRIVSVSKYIIISSQCIKVSVSWIAWRCIHSKIMPELDSYKKKYVSICTFVAAGLRTWFHSDMFWYFWIFFTSWKYLMCHEMTLKLYFMKCSETKISHCILPLTYLNQMNEQKITDK